MLVCLARSLYLRKLRIIVEIQFVEFRLVDWILVAEVLQELVSQFHDVIHSCVFHLSRESDRDEEVNAVALLDRRESSVGRAQRHARPCFVVNVARSHEHADSHRCPPARTVAPVGEGSKFTGQV